MYKHYRLNNVMVRKKAVKQAVLFMVALFSFVLIIGVEHYAS